MKNNSLYPFIFIVIFTSCSPVDDVDRRMETYVSIDATSIERNKTQFEMTYLEIYYANQNSDSREFNSKLSDDKQIVYEDLFESLYNYSPESTDPKCPKFILKKDGFSSDVEFSSCSEKAILLLDLIEESYDVAKSQTLR